MSRQQQVLDALSSITEQDNNKSKKEDDQPSIYEMLSRMDEHELMSVKKQVDHLVEKKEGERRRLRERMNMQSETDEEKLNKMFTGL